MPYAKIIAKKPKKDVHKATPALAVELRYARLLRLRHSHVRRIRALILRLRLASRRFRHSRHLEVARRLRQNPAVEGGTSHESNVVLDQKDALHVRTCHQIDIASDLPEDVLRLCAVQEDNLKVRAFKQISRYLKDEDVGITLARLKSSAFKVDVTGDGDTCVKGVDSGIQWSCAAVGASENAIFVIDPKAIGVGPAGGVSVRSFHVADGSDQLRRSGCSVVRRVELACDLLGFRKLSTRVQRIRKADHGFSDDGRDGDVSGDSGVGYGGDAGLGEDSVVAGSTEINGVLIGLRIRRKREEEKEDEGASVISEHDRRWFKSKL
jgi:hypothetical protein